MNRRIFCLLTIAVLVLSSRPIQAQDRFAGVAQMADAIRQELGAPGLSVAVAIDDRLQWSSGFGFADIENDVPARGNTVYRIASISKTIGATAVLQLVEAGKVRLDDPIGKYVPSYPKPVTLRQILLHTSGVRHYKPGENSSTVRYETLRDAIRVFRDDPLVFEPGTKTLYSSYAFNLLAGVIETATGVSLESYLNDRIFGPSGMSGSFLDFDDRVIPHRSRAYERAGTAVRHAPHVDNSIKWTGGGLLSSAEDLIRYHIALNSGKLVGPESLRLMSEPGRLNDGTPIEYSLGWEVSDDAGMHFVDKYGSGTGVSTYLLRVPAKKFAVAVLVNLSRGNIKSHARRIADAALAVR